MKQNVQRTELVELDSRLNGNDSVSYADLRCGIYRHYKGKEYLILGIAKHSETGEILVAYVPLYAVKGPQITVRPYHMFVEKVTVAGKKVSRFEYIKG